MREYRDRLRVIGRTVFRSLFVRPYADFVFYNSDRVYLLHCQAGPPIVHVLECDPPHARASVSLPSSRSARCDRTFPPP